MEHVRPKMWSRSSCEEALGFLNIKKEQKTMQRTEDYLV